MAFLLMRTLRWVLRGLGAGASFVVSLLFRSRAFSVPEASTSLRSPAALFRDLVAFAAGPVEVKEERTGSPPALGLIMTFLRTGSPPADEDA